MGLLKRRQDLPAVLAMPSALGWTGLAGAVGTKPSTHFRPGSRQTSWPTLDGVGVDEGGAGGGAPDRPAWR